VIYISENFALKIFERREDDVRFLAADMSLEWSNSTLQVLYCDWLDQWLEREVSPTTGRTALLRYKLAWQHVSQLLESIYLPNERFCYIVPCGMRQKWEASNFAFFLTMVGTLRCKSAVPSESLVVAQPGTGSIVRHIHSKTALQLC
jgi:hypothetical protein